MLYKTCMPLKSIKVIFFIVVCCFSTSSFGKSKPYAFITSDIDHFWEAYDSLAYAQTYADSVDVIQRLYIDRASAAFQDFIDKRALNAKRYVQVIHACPKFWQSIRANTNLIEKLKPQIDSVFARLEKNIPGYKQPDVCFAIGCLNTGGTTTKNTLLIGSEIVLADYTTDKSELNDWLRSVMDSVPNVPGYIGHETVHTLQTGIPFWELPSLIRNKSLSLLNMSILEGIADFITVEFLDMNINDQIHSYGDAHYDSLCIALQQDIDAAPFALDNWLYNGSQTNGVPADLGYYMGYRFAKAYYDSSTNKKKAIRVMLKRGQYKKVAAASNCLQLH